MVSEISALASGTLNISGISNVTAATDFSNAIQLAQQNPAPDVVQSVAPPQESSTMFTTTNDIIVRGSHFSKNDNVVHKIFEQAQDIVNLSDTLAQRSSTDLAKTAGLENSHVDTSLANSAVGDLKQAFDFAIRTYFLSKVVSESSAGLKSLWTAQ